MSEIDQGIAPDIRFLQFLPDSCQLCWPFPRFDLTSKPFSTRLQNWWMKIETLIVKVPNCEQNYWLHIPPTEQQQNRKVPRQWLRANDLWFGRKTFHFIVRCLLSLVSVRVRTPYWGVASRNKILPSFGRVVGVESKQQKRRTQLWCKWLPAERQRQPILMALILH